jgi:uncharacterized damage-inducible protein DinB
MGLQTMLEALFEFNEAMNERLWAIIMADVTDAQFVAEDDYSQGSIRNQMMHMANAQTYWLRGLLGLSELPVLDAADYGTREAARAVCQEADREILRRVRGLSEAELERVPDRWSQPVWVGLVQNAQHATDHRAQVLRALYGLGAPTFEQNFSDYMEYRTPMTAAALLEHTGRSRAAWDELLRQVPAGEMDKLMLDDWTVRDAVAVVTWSDRQVVALIGMGAIEAVSFGQLPAGEQERILAASRALPLAALLEAHAAAYGEMVAAVRGLSEDALNADGIEGVPPDARLWKVIAVMTWWRYPAFVAGLRRVVEGDEA